MLFHDKIQHQSHQKLNHQLLESCPFKYFPSLPGPMRTQLVTRPTNESHEWQTWKCFLQE